MRRGERLEPPVALLRRRSHDRGGGDRSDGSSPGRLQPLWLCLAQYKLGRDASRHDHSLAVRRELFRDRAVRVKLAVTAAKVAVGWDKAQEIARIRRVLEGAGAQLRKPLFLIPEVRSHLPAADCDLRIHAKAEGKEVRSKGKVERHVDVRKGADTLFTVTGAVPRDAKNGDIFLVNVAANYPATRSAKERVVEYLEVIYVRV